MKQFPVCVSILLLAVIFNSCAKSKSSPQSGGPEMPFQTAVNDKSLINIKEAYSQNTGGSETGYKLHFLANGTVSQLGTDMASVGSYSVSFWNFNTEELLATVTVNVTDTSHFFYTTVANPIAVTAGTEYVLSLHIPDVGADPHWLYTNTSGANLFPFTEGHVVAEEILDLINLPAGNSTPVFPSTTYTVDQAYLFDCDLVYTPD
jgi:hypothetical protein